MPQEVIASGIRASIAMVVFDFPSAWARSADEYFAKVDRSPLPTPCAVRTQSIAAMVVGVRWQAIR